MPWLAGTALASHLLLTASIAGAWRCALSRASSCRGAAHDSASPTNDRGHAGSQSHVAHATGLSSICIAVRLLLPQITRPVGPYRDSCLPTLLDQGQTACAQLCRCGGGGHPVSLQSNAAAGMERR